MKYLNNMIFHWVLWRFAAILGYVLQTDNVYIMYLSKYISLFCFKYIYITYVQEHVVIILGAFAI